MNPEGVGQVIFWALCLLLLIGSVLTVLVRRPINSAICLVITMIGVGILFLIMDSPFVAAMQWLVYAGAVMVLFVFIVMLFQLQEVPDEHHEIIKFPGARYGLVLLMAGTLLGFLLKFLTLDYGYFVRNMGFTPMVALPSADLKGISMMIFSKYVVTFEILSVVLLAALVGVIMLARRIHK
jgi:NADH-quinone oxidoreductase subunit J